MVICSSKLTAYFIILKSANVLPLVPLYPQMGQSVLRPTHHTTAAAGLTCVTLRGLAHSLSAPKIWDVPKIMMAQIFLCS